MAPICVLTGASGFIGQILDKALQERGFSTFSMPSFRELDAKELSALYPVGEKILINCSGVTPSSFVLGKSNYKKDNISSIEKIFQSMRQMNFTRVVHISTSRLNNPTNDDEYQKSKKESEHLVASLSKRHDLHWKIVRIPNVWSSSINNNSRFLDLLLKQYPTYNLNEINNLNTDLNIISEASFVRAIIPLIFSDDQISGIKLINGWQGTPDKFIIQLKSNTQEAEIVLLQQTIIDLLNCV
jgi:nucleoside-diphosphate-sugar epimerase